MTERKIFFAPLVNGVHEPQEMYKLNEAVGDKVDMYANFLETHLKPEVQKIFFFLSSRYNCAIFSATSEKF